MAVISTPFSSPKRRLSRAKEHIADIKSKSDSFFQTKPYARVVGRTVNGWDEHKIKLTSDIPDSITDLAYEAIEALRSSLDQAMYPIAVACAVKRPDLIHFPVADTSLDVDNIFNGRLKDFPANILALLRGFKPYKGGNDLIWALNRVRRQGTHRLIVPVGMTSGNMRIKHMSFRNSTPTTLALPNPQWNGEKNEIVYAVHEPGTNLDYTINLTFLLAFGPVEGLAGKPVVNTLHAIASEVERIILGTEAEARRIGLIT